MLIVFVVGVALFLLSGARVFFRHRRDRRERLRSLERWAEHIRRHHPQALSAEPLPWEHATRASDGTPRP